MEKNKCQIELNTCFEDEENMKQSNQKKEKDEKTKGQKENK